MKETLNTSVTQISNQCTNLTVRSGWLVGDCLTGVDATTRIQSAVWLENKIAVKIGNATLRWSIDINETVLIEKYCHDCNIVDGTATLGCVCSPPLGHVMNTTLNLEEHIGAYNGHLLSDIFSPPKPRDTPSTYPLPAQFLYGFGGNATCSESPTNRSKDWCSDYSQSCTNSNRTDRRDEGWTYNGPITCYIPQVWFPDAFHFYAIKLMGEGAWELLGYPDESCKQSPVVHITSEDMGVCKTTIPMVKAISVKPMFNGDPF